MSVIGKDMIGWLLNKHAACPVHRTFVLHSGSNLITKPPGPAEFIKKIVLTLTGLVNLLMKLVPAEEPIYFMQKD